MQYPDDDGLRRRAFTADEEQDDRVGWFWLVFGPPINAWTFRGAFTIFDLIRVILTLLGAVVGAVMLWRFGVGWSLMGAVVGAWAWRPLLVGPLVLVFGLADLINRRFGG